MPQVYKIKHLAIQMFVKEWVLKSSVYSDNSIRFFILFNLEIFFLFYMNARQPSALNFFLLCLPTAAAESYVCRGDDHPLHP